MRAARFHDSGCQTDGKPHQKTFFRMPVSGRELMYETLAAAWFKITTTIALTHV